MGRAGDRIFRDTFRWGEEPRDEIAIRTGRRDNDGEAVQGFESFHIGLEQADFVDRAVTNEIIARAENVGRSAS